MVKDSAGDPCLSTCLSSKYPYAGYRTEASATTEMTIIKSDAG